MYYSNVGLLGSILILKLNTATFNINLFTKRYLES